MTATIAIVGAGNMGTGIVRRLTAAGHHVQLTDRSRSKAVGAAQQGAAGQPGSASAVSEADALRADIIVLAVYYPGTVDFAVANSAALAGKIVVDIANPLDETYIGLSLAPTTSAAEELARALPRSTVVKAFNTVPASTLMPVELNGESLDVFVASDDDIAKAKVLALFQGSGLRALDAGPLANARLLERLTAFAIEIAQRYGLGFGFGLKYLPARPLTVSL
jgi:8-hydroxy-5-deazaflavin:NADPH oxidoreductase